MKYILFYPQETDDLDTPSNNVLWKAEYKVAADLPSELISMVEEKEPPPLPLHVWEEKLEDYELLFDYNYVKEYVYYLDNVPILQVELTALDINRENNQIVVKEKVAKKILNQMNLSIKGSLHPEKFYKKLIDYVDLLKPPSRRKDRKEEIDDLHYGTKGLAKELDLPIWSVSQVNRAGAKDEVVEGDKSAGSYEKQAIVDFGMSQSRLKTDKVNGTGRWHIQKNRYGPDGMTYNVNIDTSCGHIEVLGEYDDTEDYKAQQSNPKTTFGGISDSERGNLKNIFQNFQLENNG